MNLMKLNHIKTLYDYFNNGKKKNNLILEPFQAMIQLAILSKTPVKSKLMIDKNILFVQTPSIIQPISRWYNEDKKDDLYFLFQVIRRFLKWYISIIPKELKELIITMSVNGLDNLIKTYQETDNQSIIQVINMYKNILLNNILYVSENDDIKDHNIDEIFQNIVKIYDNNITNIIYNLLKLINEESNDQIIENYVIGLNYIMEKYYNNIRVWIMDKLIA
jgi:hypothetical protein